MPRYRRLNFIAEAIARHHGQELDRTHIIAAVDNARHAWDRAWNVEKRTMPAIEWLSVILYKLEVDLPAATLANLARQIEDSIFDYWPQLVPEGRKVLPRLATRFKLAVISDTGLTPGRVLYEIMETDQLTPYFSAFTFSDQLGSSKPHKNNFLATLTSLDSQPDEAAHVGDLLRTDIVGAKNVGMRAIQYIGVKKDKAPHRVAPDAIIRNHQELNRLLSKW